MNHKLIQSQNPQVPLPAGFGKFKAPSERGSLALMVTGHGETKPGKALIGRQINEENFHSSSSIVTGTKCIGPEDAIFTFFNNRIFAAGVFDGLGGKRNGESASREAAATLLNEIEAFESSKKTDKFKWVLESAFLVAADRLDRYGDGRASTAVAFIADNKTGEFAIASCGDSSAYLVSKKKAELLAGGFFGEGMEFEEFSLERRMVESALGSRFRRIDFREGVLSKGDSLVLASDGLTNNLEIKPGTIVLLYSKRI